VAHGDPAAGDGVRGEAREPDRPVLAAAGIADCSLIFFENLTYFGV